GLITLVGLITIGLSTYLILYSHQIYEFISPALGIFQRKIPYRENEIKSVKIKKYELIIIGLGRFGTKLCEMLDEHPEINYLGIDFDPSVIKRCQLQGKDIVYGDIEDPEILEHIPFQETKLIICTVPDYRLSKQLTKALKRENYTGKVYLTALNDAEYQRLIFTGAEQVLRLQQMAATNFYNSYLKEILL
ncbi:MAG: NAD-binding protein, partial [Gillisia sp.]|nr:NAD-binding protein [Gillisia sp.]